MVAVGSFIGYLVARYRWGDGLPSRRFVAASFAGLLLGLFVIEVQTFMLLESITLITGWGETTGAPEVDIQVSQIEVGENAGKVEIHVNRWDPGAVSERSGFNVSTAEGGGTGELVPADEGDTVYLKPSSEPSYAIHGIGEYYEGGDEIRVMLAFPAEDAGKGIRYSGAHIDENWTVGGVNDAE